MPDDAAARDIGTTCSRTIREPEPATKGRDVDIRSQWVDFAKAAGILLVVYGHMARGVSLDVGGLGDWCATLDSVVYSFHMPLFFFLSGLFFSESFRKRGGWKLVLNKVDTIVYPYLLWSFLQGGIGVLLARYTNAPTTFASLLSIPWMPMAQFWFLYALFAMFVVCAALFALVPRMPLAAVVLVALVMRFLPGIHPGESIVSDITNQMVFFAAGIAFSFRGDAAFLGRGAMVATLAILFACGQYLFHAVMARNYTDRGAASLLLSLVSILFVVSASSYLSRWRLPRLAALGSASMAIYLMHILAGSGCRVVLKRVGVGSPFLQLALSTLAGVLLPLAAVWVIRRFRIPYAFSAPLSELPRRAGEIAVRALGRPRRS